MWVLPVLGALAAAAPIEVGAPPCPADVAHHHRVRVWASGEVAGDADFLRAQVARANALFAAIDTCFELEAEAVEAPARVSTREERDRIGRARFAAGDVHVFLVDRLDDVDVPADESGELTQIRGVHWRDRAARPRGSRRWIILSRVAPPHVLAHELGHFFSLPHGDDPASIMNKTWRATPPESERGFTAAELDKMRGAAARMRKARFLVERAR